MEYVNPAQPAAAKLTIGSLDQPDLTIKAHYNPKELGVSKKLPWKEHNEQDPKILAGKAPAQSKQDSVELTGAPSRTMQLELLFDGYETGRSVAGEIAKLEELSSPQFQAGSTSKDRRAHFCVVVWGKSGIPSMRCVIEQLDVKYTMFDGKGTPLRATCTVNVKEARLELASADKNQEIIVDRSLRPNDPARAIQYARDRKKQPVAPAQPGTPVTPAVTIGPKPAAPRPPSPAASTEAKALFEEVNGPPAPPKPAVPAVPHPPSPASSTEAKALFEEVNGPALARPAVPAVPARPPSLPASRDAMALFDEVNGPRPPKVPAVAKPPRIGPPPPPAAPKPPRIGPPSPAPTAATEPPAEPGEGDPEKPA